MIMDLSGKKEVILVLVILLLILIIGNYVSTTGQVSKNYYCQDTDGKSTLIQGVVTYNTGTDTGKKYVDICLEEDKTGGLVHEYYCIGKTMREENLVCAPTYKCVRGRCIKPDNNFKY